MIRSRSNGQEAYGEGGGGRHKGSRFDSPGARMFLGMPGMPGMGFPNMMGGPPMISPSPPPPPLPPPAGPRVAEDLCVLLKVGPEEDGTLGRKRKRFSLWGVVVRTDEAAPAERGAAQGRSAIVGALGCLFVAADIGGNPRAAAVASASAARALLQGFHSMEGVGVG